MEGLPLDHVAIAVTSLEAAAGRFQDLTGTPPTPVETLDAQGVRVVFLGSLELIEPLGPDTPVGRFLKGRESALHHLAYRTPHLTSEIQRLRRAGYDLIDTEPRPGARGHRVAFLHPRSTGGVLLELVEHPE